MHRTNNVKDRINHVTNNMLNFTIKSNLIKVRFKNIIDDDGDFHFQQLICLQWI